MVIIKTELQKHRTKVLDHLGLVAGMCEELKIAALINKYIPNESADKILSIGHAVVGLILNGLGYVNKRLYMVSRFFKNKPVDKLLGVSYLKSEHFNDDALARSLDALYAYGVSELYAIISSRVIKYLSKHYGLKIESGQLDNTNFHLHGGEKELKSEDGTETLLSITRGYSKDHRPDLVQIGLQLMVENKSRIPLLMKVLSGNAEEGKSYGDFIEQHVDELKNDYGLRLIVVDSKLYNQNNLSTLAGSSEVKWITRVPNTLQAVQQVMGQCTKSEFQALEGYEDYSYQVLCSTYGGVQQRWLVLYSQTKYESELKKLGKRLIKHKAREMKAYKSLAKQEFGTESLALKAADKLSKKLKYSTLGNVSIKIKKHYEKAGKPKKGQKPQWLSYHIEAMVEPDIAAAQAEKEKLGYFILATNELEKDQIAPKDILRHYKNQASVERSFRFLKDPTIVGASLFVQKPERMTALLMIMTLCLLVYSALEFKTRTLLKKEQLTFNNQNGKPIQNPSMKWIFECFEGIHLLYIADNKPIVLNLEEEHVFILNLLGEDYWKYYT